MSWNASPSDDDQNIFPHGGRMGELIRSNDWSKTPIGPIEQWPQTLLTNLATILESPIPQFICWGRELTMVYNDAYIELLGDNHPALGKSLLEVWHEAKETIEPVIDKAFAGKSVFVENTQFTLMRHGYPEETCFDFTFSPLRDAHGTVVGLLNTTLEMTQCKEKLRESEERFSKAFHANPGPMVVSDIDTGRFIDSNAKWLKMLGYTREEIIGRTSVELGIWADPGHRPKLIKELRTKGSFSEVPTEFVTKSGEIRYALWSAEVIDYGGKLVMLSLLYDVTERKRAEEELFNAHALIEGITKGTEDLIAAEDHEFRYLYFNDAYRREFKKLWGQELAIGTSMVEAMASWPEDQKRARDLWQRALNGETFKINMEFGPSKPEKQTYELQFNPVVDGEGRQIGAAHILRNVTEQVRLRDELHQRAAELEAALESLAEGVVFYDTGHMIVRMNTMALQILGFSEEDVRLPASERIKLFQIRTKEGRIPNREDLVGWRALQDEVVINDEMLVKPKGKDEFIHILTSAAPIKRPDGQIIGAIQTLNDISALKNSEQALRESQEKFSKAFFGNPGFMFISKAENGQFIEFNDAYCDLTGYSRKEMLGRTSTELGIISPDAREKLKQAILSREKTRNLEIKITRKSGETRDTIFSVDYVNLGGTPSFICSGFDITERKRIEENLRTLTNELEHRVNERTKELEQANRAKDEFLANMSHEIRTPMAGVLGLTEILLHQALPADVEADLKMIRSSAKSVLTLLNDMFDLSRINQGKFDFHPTEFELRSMVDKALGPFRYQAMAKDLDFAISLDENIPNQILCDKDRLAQVLKNLVSNAIKFTKQGFVHVEMKAEALDDDTLQLAVSVSDSGIGIPQGKQKDIFNAFTQLDSSYSKKFAGMGLGLAISKSLVQGMGGEISVDSIEGEGSTFSFFVTCGWASQEEISAVEKMSLSTLPPMTVLLVEDNPVNRLFLLRALVTAGHKVGEAKDGKHALAKLVGSPYDLILMDIQMPVMDGIEATRQIRSGGYGREDIPIIALTAYAMKGDREKFLAEGMNGYVTKPVDFGELARTIAETCALEVTKP